MSFSLTRKTDYALVALAALAEHSGDGEARPLSAREIAERFDLPLPLLMNVLKDLHRAKILCSRRGAGGGYILCHDPAQVTMLQIIEANEGPVHVAMCCDEDDAEKEPCVACRALHRCPILTPMQRFDDMVRNFLAQVTLKDLMQQNSNLTHNPAAVALTHTGAR